MFPTEWVKQKIATLANHYAIVWVEDPYRLLEQISVDQLRIELAKRSQTVVRVENAYRLRQFLNGIDAINASPRFVVIDQSYTSRDPHQLPHDAKPSDLVGLSAPDWKPFVPREAILRPTVRDFLVDATGFEDWPNEVNIYPYEKLARTRPTDFVTAYTTFRATGRTLTSPDLILVGASAVLQTNLFQLDDPLIALGLAFHSEERWEQLDELFNAREREVIIGHLRALPKPVGDLFGEDRELARAALAGLVVLKQHFPENTGKQLAYTSPVFAKYRDCDVAAISEPPAWFLNQEVPRYEKLCSDDFLKHLRETLDLEKAEKARAFGKSERLSGKLRSLVSFEIERPPLILGDSRDPFRLDHLVPEFKQLKSELERIVHDNKSQIEGLRLKAGKKLELKPLLKLFAESGFYRVDRLLGRLDTLMYYVEGPARPSWKSVPGFEMRWRQEANACRDLMATAGKLRDELDFNFGRLLEERYAEVVPSEILPSDLFYEKYFANRRRGSDGSMRRAVVLVIDSMRLDIWRELIRPALEPEYNVEETLGFALLPSETYYSRRSFFAGKTPGTYSQGRETDLFAELLRRVHGKVVEFEDHIPRPSGMTFSVRSKDHGHTIYSGVFDFPDALSHEVNWDPHTLHEVQRPLVNSIRAFLRDAGQDALVFITADHGHLLQEKGVPVRIRGAIDGVGYRSAHVSQKVEGEAAARVFQIEARTLRHNATGWFVFPKPGFALRADEDDGKRFKPSANYRHGGISMVEVVVPLACLRHRSMVTKVLLTPISRQKPVVGEPSVIEIVISADTMLTSPVFITADHDGVESTYVSDVSTTPRTVTLKYLADSPGKRRITFSALLAGEKVGEASLSLDVAAAKVPEAEVAKAKLAKLFGDD